MFDVVGLDVGFENPTWAALEQDYSAADSDPTGSAAGEGATKLLVFYELDLGLNTVQRKWARETDVAANKLIALPGVAEGGPGGVLVCAENFVIWEQANQPAVCSVTVFH